MKNNRALLFANGKVTSLHLVRSLVESTDTLIAVDGGYKLIKKLGLLPQIIIGDLDSIAVGNLRKARTWPVEILKFLANKNESDLELAITLAINRGYSDIVVVGGMGGRSDHAQVNLSLLLKSTDKSRICLNDGIEEIFLVRGRTVIRGNSGDIVSLVPFGALVKGVRTRGLAYPLRGETLYPDQARGLSNSMKSASAAVTIKSGNLLCYHIKKIGSGNE